MSGLNLIVSGRAPAAPGETPLGARHEPEFQGACLHLRSTSSSTPARSTTADSPTSPPLASHAILLVETLSNRGTDKARERLEHAGFDDVTILVAGRSEPAGATASAANPATAAA